MIYSSTLKKTFTIYTFLAVLSSIFFLFASASAATYYIDYDTGADTNIGTKESPWKTAPGMANEGGTRNMTGPTVHVHAAGDIFYLKGGVVWPKVCFKWEIKYSGEDGTLDLYSSDETWYTGGSWTRPILDGEETLKTVDFIHSYLDSYFIIEKLRIIDIGADDVDEENSYGKCVNIDGGNDVTVRYCEMKPYGRHGIVYTGRAASTGKLYFHDNDFSALSNCVEIGCTVAGVILSDIQIYNNLIHDNEPMLDFGDHGDGIHLFGKAYPNDYSFTNVKIHNNRYYGDMRSNYGDGTAYQGYVFFGGGGNGVEIYNNVFGFDNTTNYDKTWPLIMNGAICLYNSKDFKIYNNTFSSDAMYGGMTGMRIGIMSINAYELDIKNNIFSKCTYAMMLEANSLWIASTAYNVGNIKTPTNANATGYVYEVTSSGTTDSTEPSWPTTPGNSVVDGTVTWTCRTFVTSDSNSFDIRSGGYLGWIGAKRYSTLAEWQDDERYSQDAYSTTSVYAISRVVGLQIKDFTLQ